MRDPFAPLSVVSITDPALFFEKPEHRAEYERTRDPSLYRARDGAVPCFFTIAPCAAPAALRIDHAPVDVRAVLAFRACVHRVALPTGEVLEAKTYESVAYGVMADEDWVPLVARRVGPRRVEEIGRAALALSMMDDADPLLQPPGQPRQS